MSEEALPSVLERLMSVIEDRRARMPSGSYTTQLFEGGVAKISAKISEEAEEVVEAAGEHGEEGRLHLIREIADLLYHLMVIMGYREISLKDIEQELSRRFGVSGLDEKASRGS